jgi:hypothetical protein
MGSEEISTLLADFFQWKTIAFFALVAFFGILGSAAKKYVTPKKDRKSDWSYIIVGSASSIAVLLVITPQKIVPLVALSIAAGYAGKTVLDNLGISKRLTEAQKELTQTKLKAEEEKKRNKNEINKLRGDLKGIINDMDSLKIPESLSNVLTKTSKTRDIQPPPDVSLLLEKPKMIQNKLFHLGGNLETLENALSPTRDLLYKDLFVIILDEDISDKKHYKIVYETHDLENARYQTQYNRVIKRYPRDTYDAEKIEAKSIEHDESGETKPAGVYKLV